MRHRSFMLVMSPIITAIPGGKSCFSATLLDAEIVDSMTERYRLWLFVISPFQTLILNYPGI